MPGSDNSALPRGFISQDVKDILTSSLFIVRISGKIGLYHVLGG
jgi:hypothetical protein